MQDEVTLKLRMLVTCEKAIFDSQSGLPSLIGIFQRLNVGINTEPLPPDAVMPFQWTVYTAWDRVGVKDEASFVQTTKIFFPDGTEFVNQQMPFTLPEGEAQARNVTNILGLPVGQEGDLILRVAIDKIASTEHEMNIHIERKIALGT